MSGRSSRAVGSGVDTLAVVLGDQLTMNSRLIRELDHDRDVVLMTEVAGESTHVPSHGQRTVMFLSAMRHFAAELKERGVRVRYVSLADAGNTQRLDAEWRRAAAELRPRRVRMVEPGEWRVDSLARSWGAELAGEGVSFELLVDEHFLTTREWFSAWAKGRRSLVMEHFYREQRRRLGVLMTSSGEPEGGVWNLDAENRRPWGRGAPKAASPAWFVPDAITRAVMEEVRRVLPGLPGETEGFAWPVTREQARAALDSFVRDRLRHFGPYEDAMSSHEPVLFHAAISPSLNLKLLDPRECVEAAVTAYRGGHAPLPSVEGFVRQIIGWREFIRGVYWQQGPEYADRNGLGHDGKLPDFFWTGETEMACLRACIGQVRRMAWGHHIQRLMVIGNFALLAGVRPRAVSDWFLGMYADGVDWVTVPNVVGMSQHADGGVVGTKPYSASGTYIDRMSDYCGGCRYDVERRTGPDACPFNSLYWDFLIRHRERFARNPRMTMILKGVDRLTEAERVEITVSASRLRRQLGVEPGGVR